MTRAILLALLLGLSLGLGIITAFRANDNLATAVELDAYCEELELGRNRLGEMERELLEVEHVPAEELWPDELIESEGAQ